MRRRWRRILSLWSAVPWLRALARTVDRNVADAATINRTVTFAFSEPISVTVSKSIADADQLRHRTIFRIAFALARPPGTRALRCDPCANRAGPGGARLS